MLVLNILCTDWLHLHSHVVFIVFYGKVQSEAFNTSFSAWERDTLRAKGGVSMERNIHNTILIFLQGKDLHYEKKYTKLSLANFRNIIVKDLTFTRMQLPENLVLIVHTYFYSLKWATNKTPHYGVPAS